MCNARVSDRIGAAPLLRIDAVHHSIALFPSTHAGVQHVNHQVAGVDDVMRAYYFLRERGVRIVFGPGRHPTSSAIFLYFEGPDGMVYEYSTGVRSITDEASYRPRQFPFAPELVLHVGLAARHSGIPQVGFPPKLAALVSPKGGGDLGVAGARGPPPTRAARASPKGAATGASFRSRGQPCAADARRVGASHADVLVQHRADRRAAPSESPCHAMRPFSTM